ncbi:PopZ family protein [Mesorhizobium sp. KR1-2]|uniref:PopZ family protein n=1 Tax=Mesorhizobium sp. KR1-2 TaxID=3156609 RepID=UPI0032B3DABF
MAQTSNAQREPSMEEILASIRRIIEDSDTTRKGSDGAIARDEADNGRLDSAVIEVDAFRAELRAARAAPEPDQTPSLADVQAQIAAESEFVPEEHPAPYFEVEPQPVDAETPAETPVLAMPEWSMVPHVEPEPAAAPTVDLVEERPAALRHEPLMDFSEELTAALEVPALELPVDPEPARVEAVAAPKAAEVARPAIISEHAGRQVAAAFGELSEAFAARSRKTFDEMAEQMLRPMLQDWLDNNLPTLVERLVREEIERVARGG